MFEYDVRARRDRPRLQTIVVAGLLLAQVAVMSAFVWSGARNGPGVDWPATVAAVGPSVVSILVDRPPRIVRLGSSRLAQPADADPGPGLKPNGSGFILDAKGTIVTNAHVVRGAKRIAVRLADGRVVDGTLIGADPRTDLALIALGQADHAARMPCIAEIPPVGAPVIALGAPFGLAGTVTSGIVSALGRPYTDEDPVDYIQHDASVNPGNSGGPLFDAKGCLVGINTAIPDETFVNAGIAYAIPARLVLSVAEEIRRDGQPRRAWLGAAVQQIDPALGAALGLDPASGLLVNDVRAGSPAAAAGLRPGDVILAFDGQALAKVRDLNKRLLYARPGASVVLTVLRDGRTSMPQFILSERAEPADIQAGPAADGAAKTTAPSKTASSPDAHPSAAAPFGIVVEEASASRGERRTEADRGGTIGAVSPDSPAAALGLRSGDRILAVGSTSVADGLHLHELLQRAKGRTVALLVQRSGDRQQYLVLSDRRDASGARAPDQSVSAIGGPF